MITRAPSLASPVAVTGGSSAQPAPAGLDLPHLVEKLGRVLVRKPADIVTVIKDGFDQIATYTRRHALSQPMPRPTRFRDLGRDQVAKSVLGPHYAAYEAILGSDLSLMYGIDKARRTGVLAESVIDAILAGPEWHALDGSSPLSLAGMGIENALESRFIHRNGVIVDVAQELHELLRETNIADDLTWANFRLPYPAVYVHFPDIEHNGAVVIRQPDGGVSDRRLDGFYAFEDVDDEGRRVYVVHLVQNVELAASPEGDAFAANDLYMSFTVAEDNDAINKTLAEQINFLHPDESAESDRSKSMRSAFDYLAKIILYMSLKDRRVLFEKDRTEADKKVRAAPAGLMRQKRAEKAQKLYDRIVIGRGIAPQPGSSEGTPAGTRAVHWRRGHFRSQRIGEGRRDVKVIFIMPTIVGDSSKADHGTSPTRKEYHLK